MNGKEISGTNKSACLEMAKEYMSKNVVDDNFREWYYAVNLLGILDYSFEESDLPKNTDELINSIKGIDIEQIENNDVNTLMYMGLLIDGLSTIKLDLVDEIEEVIIKMANISCEYSYWFKVRYYAILSLEKTEHSTENTIEIVKNFIKDSEKLKSGNWMKADESVDNVDIQSTFQYCMIKEIYKGNYSRYVR
jgi:hypothetical protein